MQVNALTVLPGSSQPHPWLGRLLRPLWADRSTSKDIMDVSCYLPWHARTDAYQPRPTHRGQAFRNSPGVAVARHFDQGCGSGMRSSGVVQDRRYWPPTNDVSWRGQFCMHSIEAPDQPYSTCGRHLGHGLVADPSGFLYSTRKERKALAADSTAGLVQLHERLVLGS